MNSPSPTKFLRVLFRPVGVEISDLVTLNFNTAAVGCQLRHERPGKWMRVFPETTPDLSGRIVLIRRGTCTFTQKSTNAAAKGAKYIIFYSDIIGTIPITAVVPGLEGKATVTASQGAEWISKLEGGTNILVHMVKPNGLHSIVVNERNTVTPGFLSVDSSWGPTYELDIKQQFAAPGGMVLSTFPRSKGYYAVLTGTSMACPLAAGIYALLMEARGTKDPEELETIISSTSKPVKFHDGRNESPFLAPVPQQGSGMIQAYDAARGQTVLSVSSLYFKDTDNFTPMRNFTIRNTSARPSRYELGHTGANTAYTFATPSDIVPDAFPNDLVPSYAETCFSPSSSVTIPAGQEMAITVHLASPAGLDGRRLPVYSGYVTVSSAGGEPLGICEYSKLSMKLAMGSALVRMYVVADNVDGKDWATVGETFQSPLKYQPRGTLSTTWDGRLANGTLAGPGRYKIVVKALHIFGNAEMDADYDVAETVAFSVVYAP
ncbi:serine endopeptidase [Colletotrichum paranaense]|uniref:Serine endopeptidase n=1 Tax=Colletotrichum paranaense TaxID=1914294 RepID=A0ABQ9T4R2_9PEZI|nr:serine endopeptidase [Colletotrichum paranaense]KAK1546746.1 serine endopeptidase [Colletotrichum paranaense]